MVLVLAWILGTRADIGQCKYIPSIKKGIPVSTTTVRCSYCARNPETEQYQEQYWQVARTQFVNTWLGFTGNFGPNLRSHSVPMINKNLNNVSKSYQLPRLALYRILD